MVQVKQHRTWIVMAVCGCLLAAVIGVVSCSLLSRAYASGSSESGAFSAKRQGYQAVVAFQQGFLAVGTKGRLDSISLEKQVMDLQTPTKENLTSIWTDGSTILVGGENGTLLLSCDGRQFTRCETSIDSDILDVTCFNGTYFACTENGQLLVSSEGTAWEVRKLDTENDLISIAQNGRLLMAVTGESDIFISSDGENWDHENFNLVYAGYYPSYVFSMVEAMGDSFFIIGQQAEQPDVPLIMFSETGEIWLQRALTAINGELPENSYPLQIRAFGWNQDQLLVACGAGRIMAMPDCDSCNQIFKVSEQELNAMAWAGDKVLIVGEDYFFDILDSTYLRQEKIKAEQAYYDLQNGAVIVDVREAAELDQDGYITGSIHIPLGDISKTLPELVPDTGTEIIFYCAKGARAQQALEQAQALGYEKVYNLGGLSDWPYGITQ